MKFMHIADLHLGKSIYGLSLMESHDQQYWVDQFISLCRKEMPDAVVIAGDVYDRASPGGDAVQLLDHLITSLAAMNISVMMIAGNHDSGQRLSFGHTLLEKQNIHIAGIVQKEMEHVVFQDEYGPVTFWLMPYVFPEEVSALTNDESVHSYEDAVRKLLSLQKIDFSERNVLIAHQNVTADGKEIERGGSESMVGGVGRIDYRVFDGFDYVALGHIHSSYPVGRPAIRYAGTPLCYHFSETRQPAKGPLEVDIKKKGEPVQISLQTIPPLHKMRAFKGTYKEVKDELKEDQDRNEYVSITITDTRITPSMSSGFHELLEKRGSILMELTSVYQEYSSLSATSTVKKLAEKPLEDLFSSLYTEKNDNVPPDAEEYRIMQYAARLVQHENIHEPLDEKDADRLMEYVQKSAGGER